MCVFVRGGVVKGRLVRVEKEVMALGAVKGLCQR